MNGERLIDRLIENEVLREDKETDSLTFSDPFQEQLAQRKTAVDEREPEEVDDVLGETYGWELGLSRFETGVGQAVLAVLESLDEFTSAETSAQFPLVAPLLTQLDRGVPPASGAPSSFYPIDGDLMWVLTRVSDKSLVYIWRENCEPCDIMREEFDDILGGESNEDFLCLAVYGPDWAPLLAEEFEVRGGPTTLFVVNGTVDARLVGAQYRQVIETEIDKLGDIDPMATPN